ncbi:MAG: hypothetical protein ABI478_14245, partial [Propionivibrio sp.]
MTWIEILDLAFAGVTTSDIIRPHLVRWLGNSFPKEPLMTPSMTISRLPILLLLLLTLPYSYAPQA